MQQSEPRTDKFAKTSYSRRLTDTDGMRALEEEENKENRPSASSGSSLELVWGRGQRQRYPKLSIGDPAPPLSSVAAHHDDEEEEEGEDLSIEASRRSHKTRGYDDSELDPDVRDEQARLARKFREVDEWEMEFEDVTFDGEDEEEGSGRDTLAR
jgi:hypothetical protein